MKMKLAVQNLASLAHEHRLAAFRMLVRAGPEGLAAGEIAANLGLPASSLSFHLSTLESAGLVAATRTGRFIHYRVEPRAVRRLLEFLTEDCCAGRPELCPELVVDAAAGCMARREPARHEPRSVAR